MNIKELLYKEISKKRCLPYRIIPNNLYRKSLTVGHGTQFLFSTRVLTGHSDFIAKIV